MEKAVDPDGFEIALKPIKVRDSSIKHTSTGSVFNMLLDLVVDENNIGNALNEINVVNMEGRGTFHVSNGYVVVLECPEDKQRQKANRCEKILLTICHYTLFIS